MVRTWFCKGMHRLAQSPEHGRRVGAAPKARVRLRVEQLEGRTVPSVFTVTNTADSGGGSLRQAIFNANTMPGADTVVFKATVSGTITLTSGELTIVDDLTITGPGAGKLTVSGNNASRVFNVAAGTDAISGLTIANGNSSAASGDTRGGGILNNGTLTVSNCTFSGNSAGADFGGGLANVAGATATVSGSTFSGNFASHGCGIYNDGAMTVNGSTLDSNSASYAGGAIFNQGGTLTINNSSLTNNSAAVKGGAIFSQGYLTINGSTFSGNSTGISGGAIANEGSPGVLTISGSTFTGNSAGSSGGAIANTAVVAVSIGGSTFSGNSASFGGAIINVGEMTVSGSAFHHNQATGGPGGDGQGGAIYNARFDNSFPNNGVMTVSNCTIHHNQATGGTGGDGQGGGIYTNATSTLDVTGSRIFQNDANAGFGGVGMGGGLYIEPGAVVCLDAYTVAHLKNNRASTSDDDVFGSYTIC